MSKKFWVMGTVSVIALPLCACTAGGELDESVGQAEGETILNNGVGVNGVGVNGVGVNGVGVNGVGVNGVGVNGVGVNGVGVNGTSLKGTATDGQSFDGDDFVNATLTAYLADGSTISLRVTDATQSATDPEIWLYTIRYKLGNSWNYLCGLDAQSTPIPAIAHAGRWDLSAGTSTGGDWISDPTMFTFACRGSTVAKCTELGYKPWKTTQECSGSTCQTHSLRAWHQACTRMLRADYCGDGQTHTMNGVPINVWDDRGIQAQDLVPSDWENDAEWGPDGAICVSDYRLTNTGDTASYAAMNCPSKISASFGCFSTNSTFFTSKGFSTPLAGRSLLRDQSDPTP